VFTRILSNSDVPVWFSSFTLIYRQFEAGSNVVYIEIRVEGDPVITEIRVEGDPVISYGIRRAHCFELGVL